MRGHWALGGAQSSWALGRTFTPALGGTFYLFSLSAWFPECLTLPGPSCLLHVIMYSLQLCVRLSSALHALLSISCLMVSV